uniref:Uncharacterized protein n=1 Tax=Picea glauca TaxID=3330 RepID=A0A117NGC1_PICGL|nr:hypothetical protein ABT39_MTgene1665 [Picea glauca]QHR91883.1 hypothetical protein Q903MT_gene5919 [Picea sitchensis]
MGHRYRKSEYRKKKFIATKALLCPFRRNPPVWRERVARTCGENNPTIMLCSNKPTYETEC